MSGMKEMESGERLKEGSQKKGAEKEGEEGNGAGEEEREEGAGDGQSGTDWQDVEKRRSGREEEGS